MIGGSQLSSIGQLDRVTDRGRLWMALISVAVAVGLIVFSIGLLYRAQLRKQESKATWPWPARPTRRGGPCWRPSDSLCSRGRPTRLRSRTTLRAGVPVAAHLRLTADGRRSLEQQLGRECAAAAGGRGGIPVVAVSSSNSGIELMRSAAWRSSSHLKGTDIATTWLNWTGQQKKRFVSDRVRHVVSCRGQVASGNVTCGGVVTTG